MRFELQQADDSWTVTRDGVEIGRFESQRAALADIAARLEADPASDAPVSLGLRFSPPEGGREDL